MKTYWGVAVYLHAFLIFKLNEGDQFAGHWSYAAKDVHGLNRSNTGVTSWNPTRGLEMCPLIVLCCPVQVEPCDRSISGAGSPAKF
jgi:hypothetical protein